MLNTTRLGIRISILAFCLAAFGFAQSQVPRLATPTATAAVEELASALVTAKTEEERMALLEAQKDLVKAGLPHALVAQGARLRSQGKLPQALAVYQLVQNIAERIGDKAGLAYVLCFLGNHTSGSDLTETRLAMRQ